ncbi:MAG: ABC transporter substrate-binding protein [Acidimicrobiales bacterium]
MNMTNLLRRPTTRRKTLWRGLAITGAAAVTLAACGGGSGTTTTTAAAAGSSTTAAPTSTTAASGGSSTTAGSGGSSTTASGTQLATGSPLTVGQLLPFTGTKAELSSWAVHGDGAAIYDVNHHGGVLGHKLVTANADDAGDAVDAVPAVRKLLSANPSFVVGPFSLVIESVINDFTPSHVPDFMIGGTTQLNHMTQPYVYRVTASDSAEVVAMAYYAIHHGYKKAAHIFDNSANTQGLVAPLTKSYEAQGGTVVANLKIVPDQSSYRSEVISAFAKHPQVVFVAFDEQTATTVFSDARQLGDLNVPFVGEDVLGSPAYAKAFGQPAAGKLLFSVAGAPPGGQAYQHFLNDYQARWGTRQILSSTYNMYDAVIIASLAMTAAHSTNPQVWQPYIVKIANPPGTKCYTYASCVSLISAGKKINYEGATGSEDFNKYHNTFSGFAVSGFSSNDQLKQVAYVSGAQVSANAG